MNLDRAIEGGYNGLYLRSVTVKVPPIRGIIAIVSVMQSLALSTSCTRLIHRTYIHKFWWDDIWAAIAFLCDLVAFILFLLTTRRGSLVNLGVLSRWITLLTYTIALWTSRLTISVTITRLLPEGRMRRLSKAVSVIFCLFLTSLFFQKVFVCGTNWRHEWQCVIPKYTGILELIMDIIGDLWLLLAPAHMLWHMKLNPTHHRLIFAIFACGVLTMLVSIVHSVFIFIVSPAWIGISAFIQLAVSLIVSNLLVLVTAMYRVLRRRRERAAGTTIMTHNRTTSNSSNGSNRNASVHRTDATSAAPHTTTEYTSYISLTEISESYLGRTIASGAPPSSFLHPGAGEMQQGIQSTMHSATQSEA